MSVINKLYTYPYLIWMRRYHIEAFRYTKKVGIEQDRVGKSLGGMFVWAATPQGFKYWSDLENKWSNYNVEG